MKNDTITTEKFKFFWKSHSIFSNWYISSFEIDGIEFNCSEQYMMYAKAMLFKDTHMAKRILSEAEPEEQKKLGRRVKGFDRDIWEENCKAIVYDACKAKFEQNAPLLKKIMATDGYILVEASPFDTIWGIGLRADDPAALDRKTWRGKNYLGEILTTLRENLKNGNTTNPYRSKESN